MTPRLSPGRRAATPIVIAHRGASGYRPEHTLAAYQLAIDMGADYVEPDLVSTKDGVLVARHENEIGGTTDVAARPVFADRRTAKRIDGREVTGWFTEDFTLAELKTLRARERLPQLRPESAAYDGRFEIPALEEIINLVRQQGREVGIYPEIKHPTYFAGIGLALEDRLVAQLHANGYRDAAAPVFIQCFEVAPLRTVAGLTRLRRIQLLDIAGGPWDQQPETYAALGTPAGLARVAEYAWGIGPHKGLLLTEQPGRLAEAAHAAGLAVHAWTFRRENYFLPPVNQRGSTLDPAYLRRPGDLAGEITSFLNTGLNTDIDGFFTDNPDLGRAAVDRLTNAGKARQS